jgi:hypothetical protein
MKIRGFLEFKNGEFRDTLEVLVQPDTWKELTPSDRRLVKRYAAKTLKVSNRQNAVPETQTSGGPH